MIRDLSTTLQALLDDPKLSTKYPELAAAQIAFDRPSDPYKPGQTTVNLFLYDVRENVDLRSNEPEITRKNGQAIIMRPPLRVACSYLVTAWPVSGAELVLQEHRLLSQALQVLSEYSTIPAKYLQGSLSGQEPPLPMITSQLNGLQNVSEFWTALGNKLRPALTVTVTIGLEVFEFKEAPLIITKEMRIAQADAKQIDEKKLPEARETTFRIGGRVTDAADKAVADAQVTLVEVGLVASTDMEGRYRLGRVPAGIYTLRVQFGNTKRERQITIQSWTSESPPPKGHNYDVQLA